MTVNNIKSIQDRLRNIAKKLNIDFSFILRLYFHERILYRISISKYKTSFILKGGLLLTIFNISSFRPTKDVDLLGKNVSGNEQEILNIFKKILSADMLKIDGILFNIKSMTITKIREDNIYEGLRLSMNGSLGNIKEKITIDIGFGDIITPNPLMIEYPAFLENKPIKLFAYNYETVIAEKIEACCKLGFLTSRMKDFYDILFLLRNKDINYTVMEKAINTTFKQRETSKNLYTTILNNDFIKEKQRHWASFLSKIKHDEKITFEKVINFIDKKIGKIFN
ncbi:MAG: nucleotidyl transferase AbiEii/AbiGii toxin family protein [Spirochaetes bacterium]|nr:nucleotidyl transferase AbiEii/AbiGii toxin family protein [Spirochaetota bacterium]